MSAPATRPPVTLWPSGDMRGEFDWSGAAIPDHRLRALALGAYVDRGSHTVDELRRACLRHGDDPTACARRALADDWGIGDAVELRKMVARLLDGMHSADYETVYPLAHRLGVQVRDGKQPVSPDTLEEHQRFLIIRGALLDQDPRDLLQAHEAVYRLLAMNLLTHLTDNRTLPRHIRAWDLARVPIIVRCGFTVGMIDEGEAWGMLEAALRRAQAEYADWEMFADGLLTGRAYWLALDDITRVAGEEKRVAAELHQLFEAPTSPWRRVTLQG
ncbi:DUF1266 domain-containing protein [Tsukamurella soli]|uniref:DUF1266 domain-containing protein n=1 Tax=Tsukamurella soli TaxID=644556 RepID=A0ABP8J4J3_9ACTN